jgi:hypothetical protein
MIARNVRMVFIPIGLLRSGLAVAGSVRCSDVIDVMVKPPDDWLFPSDWK